MTNDTLFARFPKHSGLNADWSVCAWPLKTEGAVEHWLLEDEEACNDTFELVTRVWDDAEGCGQVEFVRDGVSLDEAAQLLGV